MELAEVALGRAAFPVWDLPGRTGVGTIKGWAPWVGGKAGGTRSARSPGNGWLGVDSFLSSARAAKQNNDF